MYLNYFSLNRYPFSITPDNSLFYNGGTSGSGIVLAPLLKTLKAGYGLIKLVGPVGSGKTLLCRMVEASLPETTRVVYLANPNLLEGGVCLAVARELNLPASKGIGRQQLMQQLESYFLACDQEQRKTVVIIEEAQGMSSDALEEIRQLSNLQKSPKQSAAFNEKQSHYHSLVQVLLVGQVEFNYVLQDTKNHHLEQRISVEFEIRPYSVKDAAAYMRHRLNTVGCSIEQVFSVKAENHIAKTSKGIARRINVLADKAMQAAYEEAFMPSHAQQASLENTESAVQTRHAKMAAKEYSATSLEHFLPRRIMEAVTVACLPVIVLLLWPKAINAVDSEALLLAQNNEPAKPARILTIEERRQAQLQDLPVATASKRTDQQDIAADAEPVVETPVVPETNTVSELAEPSSDIVLKPTVGIEPEFEIEPQEVPEIDPQLEQRSSEVVLEPIVDNDSELEIARQEAALEEVIVPSVASSQPASTVTPHIADLLEKLSLESSLSTNRYGIDVAPVIHERVKAGFNWLNTVNRAGYTIQLLSGNFNDVDHMEYYIPLMQRSNMLDDIYVCVSTNNQGSYWTVKYGEYAGYSVAQRAIDKLPRELKQHGAYVQSASIVRCSTNEELVAAMSAN